MEADRTTEFLDLLTRHDRALALYVYGLVPSSADAEDILQQTKMLLWREFSRFEPGTHFLAWARKIAFHQILSWRRKRQRGHLPLSDEMLESLSHEIEKLADQGDRREALRDCLSKLPHEHRQLVLLRYYEDLEIEQVAERVKSTAGAVYRALSRVRQSLLVCVEKELSQSGAS